MTHPQGMRPEDIKASIRKTGIRITLTELAPRNGLGESAARMAIIFSCRPAGECAVIERLGVAPHALWPGRYDREGNRTIDRDASNVMHPNSMKSQAPGHRQKRRAG